MTEQPIRDEAVFNAVLQLPEGERAAHLEKACAGDVELRRRVELLLSASDRAEGFLKEPALLAPEQTLALPPSEKPGDRIGHYKLLQQIGEGGCGLVYMAEQEEPVRRRVALKVIKLGMDTRQVIARFEAERQALALMDHSNIAKVLDAGATETGRPYFVMELVRGIQITDYCDQNHLPSRERLGLFIQVCQAIQHAHQKGLIHRDIKPSNILVTVNDGVPVPKVIDFGIAKATQGRLTDRTLFTAFEQFVGTPAYMSPEQAVMTCLDIDTRSDIYSLGVLLYELLTGKTPFDAQELLSKGIEEMRRTIREVEPLKPSTRITQDLVAADARRLQSKSDEKIWAFSRRLLQEIRGDLDWIVMKCLEKDRSRRYETASGLARDIQRYLRNEPVVARPPTAVYRFQKAVRRNKTAFGAAAGIAGMLFIGMGASTTQAIRAARAEREQARLRQIAETKEKKSEQVAQFLKEMLQGVGPSVAMGRDTTMLREIMDKTAERVGRDLKDQPEVEIELGLTLGWVYLDLQEYRKVEQTAHETVRLARAHFGEENLAVADALSQMASALRHLRVLEDAEFSARRAIVTYSKLLGSGSLQEALALVTLGDILRLKALLSQRQASMSQSVRVEATLAEGEISLRAALAILRKRLGNDNQDVAETLLALNILLDNEGNYSEAETAIRESVTIFLKLFGEDHPLTASAYNRLGHTLTFGFTNRLVEAEACERKALEIQKRTEGEGKPSQMWSHYGLAAVLEKQGQLDEAEIHSRNGLAIARKQMGNDFPALPVFLNGLAVLLWQKGNLAEARQLAEEAIAIAHRDPGHVERSVKEGSVGILRIVLIKLGDTNALEKLNLSDPNNSAPPK